MSNLKFEKVVSFSSESKGFPASNLVSTDSYKKWQCQKAGEGKAFVILKLREPTIITGIDIGNAGSAFLEILVSENVKDFSVLLPTSSFMSPMESRTGEERNRVRIFNKFAEGTSQKPWLYVKVICSQPFDKTTPFGITFIKMRGKTPSKEKDAETDESPHRTQFGDADAAGERSRIKFDQKEDRKSSLDRSNNCDSSGVRSKKNGITDDENRESRAFDDGNFENIAVDDKNKEKEKHISLKRDSNENRQANGKHGNNSRTRTSADSKDEPPAKRFNRGFEVESDEDDETDSAGPSTVITSIKNGAPSSRRSPKKRRNILDGVVFVLSGFQNPLRSQLRSQALAMGAKYAPDWNDRCTHLVCAFPNTPKWTQVANTGGKIVTKDWFEECQKTKKIVPWRDFKCGKYRDKVIDVNDCNSDPEASDQEEENYDDDDEYVPSSQEQQESMDDSFIAPDDEHEEEPESHPDDQVQAPEWQGGELGRFFAEKRFHIKDDVDDVEEKDTLIKYIVGHGGQCTMRPEKADHIISWDEQNASSPLWVVKCHQENKLVDNF